MDMTIIVVTCGAGTGVGLVLLSRSWKGFRSRRPNQLLTKFTAQGLPVVLGAGGLGAIVGVLTGWPVAAIFTALGLVALPGFLRATRRSRSTERTEAIAVWTELLRDTLSAASGLSQAIVATAPLAPDALKSPVSSLATRITNGMPLVEALRLLAAEVNDPSIDLVVCSLTLAASARTQRVSDLLGALAGSMREEVVMRLRVESGRASARSGVRTIAIFSVAFMAVLLVIARPYLSPFGSSQGQVVLAISFLFDGLGIVYMLKLVRDPQPVRLLGTQPESGAVK